MAVRRGADLQVQYGPVDAFDIDFKMQQDDAYYAPA